MGERGRVPKRSENRRRRNEPQRPVIKAAGAALVDYPPPDAEWHPVALHWYESLARSGQSRLYEPSDWGTAWAAAENLSRELKPKFLAVDNEGEPIYRSAPLTGAAMASFLKACSVLGATEGDRRRMQVELQRPEAGSAGSAPSVASLEDYRSQFQAG